MSVTGKAVWHIESHLLDGDLSLDAAAEAAGVSRFHLSRAFGVSAGVPLGVYVRTRRLSEAAKRLAAGAPDILEVALDAGYNSHEAFTRAFRQYFGVTPDRYRREPGSVPVQEAIRMNPERTTSLGAPRIVEGEEMLIFGLGERYSQPAAAGIPAQWGRFSPYIDSIFGRIGDAEFGVVSNFDDASGYLYVCGVQVRAFPEHPAEFTRMRIPAQTYAVFEHREHVSAVFGTWRGIWEHGLVEAGYEGVDAPCFEWYGRQFDGRTGMGGFEIWVPVRPLGRKVVDEVRLSRAMIFVKDLGVMAAFYSETLGLRAIAESRTATYIEFESGLALHAVPAEVAARISIASPPVAREKAPTKITFEADDLGSVVARLEAAGAPKVVRSWGGVDWLDPEGNVFGLRGRG